MQSTLLLTQDVQSKAIWLRDTDAMTNVFATVQAPTRSPPYMFRVQPKHSASFPHQTLATTALLTKQTRQGGFSMSSSLNSSSAPRNVRVICGGCAPPRNCCVVHASHGFSGPHEQLLAFDSEIRCRKASDYVYDQTKQTTFEHRARTA